MDFLLKRSLCEELENFKQPRRKMMKNFAAAVGEREERIDLRAAGV